MIFDNTDKEELLQNEIQTLTSYIPTPYNKSTKLNAFISAFVKTLYRNGDFYDFFSIGNLENATGKLLNIHGDKLNLTRDYNGTTLNDDDYKTLLKLRYTIYYGGFTIKNIVETLYKFFGNDIKLVDNNNGTVNYFVTVGFQNILQIAIDKNCLPRPTGIKVLLIVINNNKPFFGFARSGQATFGDNIIGMRPDNIVIDGEMLKSNQIIQPLFE